MRCQEQNGIGFSFKSPINENNVTGNFDSNQIFADICIPISKKHYSTIDKVMSRVCQITGKKVQVGNNVSHAKNRTKRKFYPNLQKKRFYIPEEDTWITLKVSTSAIRTINKNGISAVLKKARASGNALV